MDYIIYYKLNNNNFRCWNSKTDICSEIEVLPTNVSRFKMTKGYEPNDDDLRRYGKDIYLASEELKSTKLITFDYIKPYITKDGKVCPRTHFSNIETIFKMLSKGKYEHHEPISSIEKNWFERCYNAGLQYTDVGTFDCYGYDFKNYYGSILASKEFKIPNREGRERKLNKLPPRIWTGFYNVKITSDDPNIKKIFAFSSENVYTSIDVKFALELKNTYNIDINVELITDVEFNAYIYPLDTLEPCHKIFDRWYNTILQLKKEFPKNMLLKMLSSSLWGHLSKFNCKTISEKKLDEINENDWDIDDIYFVDDGTQFYKLVNKMKPYFYNLRLKPFITAFGRVKTAKIALLDINNIVRIHTDGIVFNKEQNFNIDNLIPENKTTGKITFKNINNYSKV
jgi:hypothetical protein